MLCRSWTNGWPGLEGASPKPRGFLRSAQSSPGHPIDRSKSARAPGRSCLTDTVFVVRQTVGWIFMSVAWPCNVVLKAVLTHQHSIDSGSSFGRISDMNVQATENAWRTASGVAVRSTSLRYHSIHLDRSLVAARLRSPFRQKGPTVGPACRAGLCDLSQQRPHRIDSRSKRRR